MAKKYLRGFANLGVIPVTENTEASYKVTGEVVRLIGAQSCAPTDNRTAYSIPADDGIYDSGSQWTNSTMEIVVAETDLKNLSTLIGADYDSTSEEQEEGVFDMPAEVALTFSALRADGGYRLFRYYSVKCTGYKVSHSTLGQSTDAQTYTLTFEASPRKIDGKIRGTKDVEVGAALTWLDSIPSLPEVAPGA